MTTEKAERKNEGKAQLHYLLTMPRMAEALSAVLEAGAHKYAYLNYLKGGKPDQEYWDAAMRHLMKAGKYISSENADDLYDPETGCHHVAHAIWNLAMLLDLNWTHLPITHDGQVREASSEDHLYRLDNDLKGDVRRGKITPAGADKLQRMRDGAIPVLTDVEVEKHSMIGDKV